LTDVRGLASGQQEPDLLALHEALARLEVLNPRASRVVELRFFGGLEEQETAEVLGISGPTVRRDWRFARAWLLAELTAPVPEQRR